MKGKLCGAAAVVLIGSAAIAVAGPYSIHDGTLIKFGSSYQTFDPIGDISNGIESIEFSVDGFIYGVDMLADTLVRIDPVTGLTETVGPLGFDLDWPADLDEDAQGQLWMLEPITSRLYTIDVTTGAATLHCQAENPEIFGLAIRDGRFLTSYYPPDPPDAGCGLDYVTSYSFSLETGPDGWIYGLFFYPFGFQYTVYVYYRIDPVTGVHEVLGEFGPNAGSYVGLTFDPTEQPPTALPIPALGWPGRALFTLLLAFAGVTILTRFWISRS